MIAVSRKNRQVCVCVIFFFVILFWLRSGWRNQFFVLSISKVQCECYNQPAPSIIKTSSNITTHKLRLQDPATDLSPWPNSTSVRKGSEVCLQQRLCLSFTLHNHGGGQVSVRPTTTEQRMIDEGRRDRSLSMLTAPAALCAAATEAATAPRLPEPPFITSINQADYIT